MSSPNVGQGEAFPAAGPSGRTSLRQGRPGCPRACLFWVAHPSETRRVRGAATFSCSPAPARAEGRRVFMAGVSNARPTGGVPEEPESGAEERDQRCEKLQRACSGLGEDRQCAQQECHKGAQPGVREAATGPRDPEAQASPWIGSRSQLPTSGGPPPHLWLPCQQGSLPKGLHPTTLLSFHGINGETWLEKAYICPRFRKGCVAGAGEGGVN